VAITAEFSGIDHVSLTVRNLEASRHWYEEVLGLVTLREARRDGFTRAILHFPGHGSVLGLTQHDAADVDAFRETRAGLDHVGFTVTSRSDLEEWARHFETRDVPYSGIIEDAGGSHIVIRDPDNIQLELRSPATGASTPRR
jgi:catechol 2,3-dioxygenase-like lactoylglutathione lyase family enzyme